MFDDSNEMLEWNSLTCGYWTYYYPSSPKIDSKKFAPTRLFFFISSPHSGHVKTFNSFLDPRYRIWHFWMKKPVQLFIFVQFRFLILINTFSILNVPSVLRIFNCFHIFYLKKKKIERVRFLLLFRRNWK